VAHLGLPTEHREVINRVSQQGGTVPLAGWGWGDYDRLSEA
jgi:hypothetical protein